MHHTYASCNPHSHAISGSSPDPIDLNSTGGRVNLLATREEPNRIIGHLNRSRQQRGRLDLLGPQEPCRKTHAHPFVRSLSATPSPTTRAPGKKGD